MSGETRLELFGGFRVQAGGRSLTRPPSARQQELIAYLALHARQGVARQRVAGALWPDSTDAQALTNLRRELHHLRGAWPEIDRLIDAAPRTVAWLGAPAAVDIVSFEDAAHRGLEGDRAALEQAARLYAGDLLPDCAAEWIDTDRRRLQQRARDVLARFLELLERERAFAEAIDRAQQLLRIDPLDEPTWRALMRCHARRGDRATALHTYQQCAALVKKELGVQPSAATRAAYREILDFDDESSAAPTPPPATYPLVGRDAEWRALNRSWRATEDGRPQLVVIRGEAGIGKTRLAEELADWCRAQNINVAATRCYPGEGRLAYAPIAEWLQSDALSATLRSLDAVWLTDVARLRPELLTTRPEVPAPDKQLDRSQRLKFFEALAQAFRQAVPLLVVVDDLQWSDAETLEWLHYFLRSTPDRGCLVVGTVRAEEEQDNPPLGRLLSDLQRDERVTFLTLGGLDPEATAQLASEVAEHPLDEMAVYRTFQETEGHPLFIIERGRMDRGEHTASAPGKRLPRVQSVVAARLALLSDQARSTAEIASVVGRDFSFAVLAHVSDLEEDALVAALDELWRRQIVRAQASERWDFTHDRIREVAYDAIGPARRRLVHRRIAQAMELLFADRLDEASAAIAMHLERGGQPSRAIGFFARAAEVAARVSANEEAIRNLTQALALLDRLPPGRERDDRELTLRDPLSSALNSARGYSSSEVEDNLNRVFALLRADSNPQVAVRWLWAGFGVRIVLGDLKGAREMAGHALARAASDASCLCEAHHAMAGALLFLGELEPARRHFDAALDAYDLQHPQRSSLGSDLGVFANAWSSHAMWLLGDEPLAIERAHDAIELAGRRDDPYSRTLALAYAALLHQLRGDVDRMLSSASDAVALCERHGFAYYDDWARVLIGWARGQTHPHDGVVMIRGALDRLNARRAQARRPYYLSLLVETLIRAGNPGAANSTLDIAIDMALDRGDVWWLPALYLQKSELEAPEAREAMRDRALALARTQGSRALEQRILAANDGTLARTIAERPTS